MMTDTKIDLNAYIHRQIHCSCGHTHYSGVRLIDIDRGAVRRLPGHIRELGYDLVLAVGSGTINDLCKFVSHRLGIDYIIFASAPSMAPRPTASSPWSRRPARMTSRSAISVSPS
ncbi:MAG: iron-containing alcohol dehydrogenase [Lachnospiraceae bacterium]|nr:iron-containing alcohol dehydrogenase [Lachnospiraceae bacterium]